MRKYAGRIPTVHLKDFAGRKAGRMYGLIGLEDNGEKSGDFEFRPLGKGFQDIPAIVKAAVESGAQWLIVEQDEPSMGLGRMECAQASIEYLMGVLEEY